MNPIASCKNIFFDLDGTLIDHFNCLYICFNYAFKKMGFSSASYEEIRQIIGGGLPRSLGHFVGTENLEEALKHFYKKYEEIALNEVIILEGAHWILESLYKRGYKLAILTNKTGHNARKLCEHVGFSKYLSEIFGGDDTPYFKPEKEYTQHVLEKMNVLASESLLIGDTHFDIETAHAVGMPCIIVTTGAQNRDSLKNFNPPPQAIYDSLIEMGIDFFGLEYLSFKPLV